MMTSLRNMSATVVVALVIAAVPANSWAQGSMSPVQDGAARNAEVAKLIAVLQCDAAPFDKAQACQRLALIGTKEAVPALAALWPMRGSAATRGLDSADSGPSVDDALRDALGRLHGRLLSGVINSIGVRRARQGGGP